MKELTVKAKKGQNAHCKISIPSSSYEADKSAGDKPSTKKIENNEKMKMIEEV